jgi:hypothetical protein
VRFDDGAEVHERWDGEARWRRYRYQRPARVVEATVDPATDWLLDGNLVNNGLRREPDTRPAHRVSLGLGFWLQSLWQALGL